MQKPYYNFTAVDLFEWYFYIYIRSLDDAYKHVCIVGK